jgi:hypothetical protein
MKAFADAPRNAEFVFDGTLVVSAVGVVPAL